MASQLEIWVRAYRASLKQEIADLEAGRLAIMRDGIDASANALAEYKTRLSDLSDMLARLPGA